MKKILPFLSLLFTSSLFAQEFVGVSYGGSYSEMAFYRLSDDETTNVSGDSWDVAFTVIGDTDAGISINEAAVVFGTQRVLFLAPTNDFNEVISAGDLTERLLNVEKSWESGAFNSVADPGNSNDFGWGILDPNTGTITGNRVFVVRSKDGSHRKMQIVSLDQGVYTVKLADLDGANETTLTIDKADYPDSDLAYLSLASNALVTNIPGDWDLLFTRYSAPQDDGAGGTIEIMTSGTLSAPGVEVAEARGVLPDDAQFADYEAELSDEIDVIGFDWKSFENNTMWVIPFDLSYFVKTETGQVWKVIFVDFDGSSTGNVVFTKELVVMSSVQERSAFESVGVYPNPLSESSVAVFSLKSAGTIQASLSNLLGQPIWKGQQKVQEGLNTLELHAGTIPSGTYFLTLQYKGETLSVKLVK